MTSLPRRAFDLVQALQRWNLIHRLAVYDLKQRYRRSYLGTLWITIGMIVWILTITFVFNSIFRLSVEDFLPYVALGVVVWNFFSSSLTESGNALVNNQEYIKSGPLPLSLFVLKAIWLNAIIAAQNLAVAIVVVVLLRPVSLEGFAGCAIGILVLILNVGWMSFVLAVVCTRFRDVPAIVANALQILFYLSPVVWVSSLVTERVHAILKWNPLYHLLASVRDPLILGTIPWRSVTLCVVLAALGWIFAVTLFERYRRFLPYWIG